MHLAKMAAFCVWKLSTFVLVAVAIAALSAVGSGVALAGPLVPPAGPVTDTPGPEPRTPISATTAPGDASSMHVISQPGSYYLTGNLVATGTKNGITIASDNVTLDLNGFTVSQATDGTGFPVGIRSAAPVRNAVVKNGTVRAFRGYGFFGNFNTSAFHELAVLDCLGGQLEIGASLNVTVRNVRTRAAQGEVGIQVGASSLVESCTTDGGTIGITVGTGSTVRSCVVVNPISIGIAAASSLVIDCTVSGGTSTSSFSNGAISTTGASRIERCIIRSTQAAGVFVSGRGDVVDCTFNGCVRGVATSVFGGGRVTVTGCTFNASTTAAISLATPGNFVAGNRFSGNTANIDTSASTGAGPNGGNAIAEIIDLTGGGTLAGASVGANIVY